MNKGDLMIKLTIKNIEKYCYTLEDESKNIYISNIEFYDLNKSLEVNDLIYINNALLPELSNQLLCFGSLDEKYGRNINKNYDKDLLIIEYKNKERCYLKRLYG